MADIDFDRVNVLLSVVHQCASVGPRVAQLASAAQAELNALNDSLKPSVPASAPVDLRGEPAVATDVKRKV